MTICGIGNNKNICLKGNILKNYVLPFRQRIFYIYRPQTAAYALYAVMKILAFSQNAKSINNFDYKLQTAKNSVKAAEYKYL
jgi:hypothetical protein